MNLKTQIITVAIVVLAVGAMAFLSLAPSPITGFISASTYVQEIDAKIDSNSNYYLIPSDIDANTEIKSLRVSGKVFGDGVVNVYIEDSKDERHLVYSNEKVRSFNRITGFAIGPQRVEVDYQPTDEETLPFVFKQTSGDGSSYIQYEKEPETKPLFTTSIIGLASSKIQKEDLTFDFFDSIPDDENRLLITEFKGECIETCAFFSLDKSFKFIFEIESGTYLQLTEIIYTVNEENAALFDKYDEA